MATRKTFNDDDDSIANAIPHRPVRTYACSANQCPMSGAIFASTGTGVCAYHYGTHGSDWPRITQTLLDWAIVSEEISHARRLFCNPSTAADPAHLAKEFTAATQRVQSGAGSWWPELKPQLTRGGQMDTFSSWINRLEAFLGQRVVESLRHRIGRKAA